MIRLTPALLLALILGSPAAAQDPDGDDGPGRPVTEITVTARRLDAARENINSALGASVYALGNDTVESRPSGETTSVGQVLLQAPGVTQDASGQLRVRQSQGTLQYRINNVILPDGLTDPGDTLSARLAAKVELVTGALPAQYGLQAGGVVNITTKDGIYLAGGQAELYGGSRATFQPAFELGGSAGTLNYFASGQYQRSDAGLAPTDGSSNPAHDRTTQGEAMVYLDRLIGSQNRVSLIIAASEERFQIPGPRGVAVPAPNDATQRNANRFAVASLLHTTERFTLQVALFGRASVAALDTSDAGSIALSEFGQVSRDSAGSFGGQVEIAYDPAEAHTFRGGATLTSAVYRGTSATLAYPIDSAGARSSSSLLVLNESNRLRATTGSLFAQDEWRISDALTLNWGGRLDHVAARRDDTAFSPRFNAVWRPGDTTVHLGYARYFLPAPVDAANEDAAQLASTTARLPGASSNLVLPETDDYYAIGAQHRLGNLTVGIDAYWRDARDLLDEVQLASSYRTVNFNYARGRIRGVELTAAYAAQRLSVWANLALAQARGTRIESNQAYFPTATLAFASSHALNTSGAQTVTASAGLSYRWERFRLSGDMLVGSGLPGTVAGGAPNGAHLPAYAQLNLSGVWRVATFKTYPLDLRLDVINLLDARYRLRDGTGLVPGPAAWGPRRGVFFGVEQGF